MGIFSCTHNFIQIMDEKGKPTIEKEECPPVYEGDTHVTIISSKMFCTKCGVEKLMRIRRVEREAKYVPDD
jgi:hypothetical protein